MQGRLGLTLPPRPCESPAPACLQEERPVKVWLVAAGGSSPGVAGWVCILSGGEEQALCVFLPPRTAQAGASPGADPCKDSVLGTV